LEGLTLVIDEGKWEEGWTVVGEEEEEVGEGRRVGQLSASAMMLVCINGGCVCVLGFIFLPSPKQQGTIWS
jgi:hypothetical protein